MGWCSSVPLAFIIVYIGRILIVFFASRSLYNNVEVRCLPFCLYIPSCTQLSVANCTIVTSQMNHHLIWLGWQQRSKHVSRVSLLPHAGIEDEKMRSSLKTGKLRSGFRIGRLSWVNRRGDHVVHQIEKNYYFFSDKLLLVFEQICSIPFQLN